MADNLIFPIRFDLEKAVEQAGKDWDGKFADKLEKLMAKRPVNIKFNLDVKNLDNLDAVRKRLAELKLEPITPETRNAIRSLTQELKTLEKILERIQRLNAGRESTRAYINEQRLLAYKEKTHQAEERAKKAAELTEQAKKRTEILQQRLEQQVIRTAAAEQRLANSQKNGVSNIRNASTAYAEQTTYLQRLVQRMAAYYSIQQIGNFFTKVREVTAQFELQRVSLGAIIQDQQRANALFSEIKSFALKSPVSIMDLTKYTKQLAAYKIETEELFETTKKLTDVSVGLGVSMERVVLAYGQTRATGYLRASEIRQFTEMGVPIVEELAAKLSKMNGELVTAADVMDMVSKRGISFELVKEVFDDMTSAGGMFYNMQEKQGNTLFGMWAKLGDAASVMYDEIGNTESVNKGMKDTIQLLTDIMKNWRTVANELKALVAGFAIFKTATVIIKAMQVNTIAAAAATRSMTLASIQHRNAVAAGNRIMGAYTTMLRLVAVWNRKAALSTNLFTVAAYKLKVALVSWGSMAIIAALGMLITYLVSAAEKAGRLKKELNDIAGETGVEISRMVTNFESLAKKAVEAADGSREQKDALSELQRTYRNIIPEQNLTIEKLREMKGEYSNLTIAIREYIREQQLQKGLSAISENYGKKLIDAQKEFRDKLAETKIESKDGAGFYLSEQQIDRIVGYYQVLVREGKSAQEALQETFRVEGIDHLVDNYTKLADKLGLIKRAGNDIQAASTGAGGAVTYFEESVTGLTKVIQDEEKSIADFKKQMDGTIPTLGRLTDYIDKAKKKISEHNFVSAENTFAYNQETARVQINAYIEALEEAINSTDVGIDLSEFITIDPNGVKRLDFTGLNKALSELNSKWKGKLQDLTEEVQNVYDGFIPNEATTRRVRVRYEELAKSMGVLDKVKSNIMGVTENLEDYRKKINDIAKDYAQQVATLTNLLTATPIVSTDYLGIQDKLNDVKKRADFYKKISDMLGEDLKESKPSDPRLGILQEMVQSLKQINKEYDDLAKKEGNTQALADTQKIYADTFKNMQALAEQYKFELPKFGVPTDTASLTKYLGAIKDAMAKLPKSQKAVLSLQVDIEKLDIDAKQKQIEEELKRLAEQVSRTKTAQEFYDKILGTTGDIELATNMTMSIYGETDEDMNTQMAKYISSLFGQVDVEMPMNIIAADGTIDYTAMEKFVRENEKILGDSYKELIKIAQDGQKNMAKTYEGYLKDLEVAKTYADKRIELARDTANKIAEIEAERKSLKPDSVGYEQQIAMYNEMIRGYRKREKNEAAKLDYEQIKEQIGMFDDLGVQIGTAFENILTQLREYAKSPDFARIGLEAQKNVYQQIAKLEDRMAEGFQSIGVGTVSEYVRQYSIAAGEYLTAQNNLREATLRAIEADREWERVKNSNNEAAKAAALSEKALAESRARTAAASVNAAGANLQRAQEGAARASVKFDSNLRKVESSLKSLNNGALKTLWNLIGDKGQRSVGEFLSGSKKIISAIDTLTKALSDSGSNMGELSKSILSNLSDALIGISSNDKDAITAAASESLKKTLSGVIDDKGVVDLLANTLSKNIGEIASQALNGVLSTEEAVNKVGALIDGIADAASNTGELWGAIISLVLSLLDEFAENGIGTFLGELLDKVGEAVEGILANLITDSLPKILLGIGNVVKGLGVGLADLLTFGIFDISGARRVRRANEIIESQEELVENLEYAYGRLEVAIKNAVGQEYLNTYNKQLKNLQAQQAAYMKQAEAERSKGKKTDEEKLKEYENQVRDTADKIKDMQGELVSNLVGTDIGSAAKDFADAWLDAYLSFGDTAGAIEEKFNDMMKNLIVHQALAGVVQRVLDPFFKQIDEAAKDHELSSDELANIMSKLPGYISKIDDGLSVSMEALKQAGFDLESLRDTTSGLTGISRDIASASEESINGLAAGINTQNFYISQIHANVAMIAQYMLNGNRVSNTGGISMQELVTMQNTYLSTLPAIEANTAATVARCERAAIACENLSNQLSKVIRPTGTKSAYSLSTTLN